MPAGTERPLNKGARVMNRMSFGTGSRAQPGKGKPAGNMKNEIEGGKSKLRTADAAKKHDQHWKKTNDGKVPVGNSLKPYSYGKKRKP